MSNPILAMLKHNKLSHLYLLTPPTKLSLMDQEKMIQNMLVPVFEYECNQSKIASVNTAIQRMWENKFPDIHVIDELSDKKFNFENIHTEIEKAQFKPLRINRRYYIFKNCQRLFHKQIFNKLLKFFEEPPESVSIIIFNPDLSPVPATIKSRAVEIGVIGTGGHEHRTPQIESISDFIRELKSLAEGNEELNQSCPDARNEALKLFETFINDKEGLNELNQLLKQHKDLSSNLFSLLVDLLSKMKGIDYKGINSINKMIHKVDNTSSVNLNYFDNILPPVRLLLHKYLKS